MLSVERRVGLNSSDTVIGYKYSSQLEFTRQGLNEWNR